jgi:uncharacterized protein YutE (UPF0331/DUF86 family)
VPVKSILKKIKTVETRVVNLKNLAEKLGSFEEYISSQDHIDIAERNLQVAIESCLDLGKIIITNKKLQEPSDNKGVFAVLAEADIIAKESLRFLMPMAGTRNILVHGYDRVDDALIYGILKKHLNNFEEFLSQIKKNSF